MKVLQTIKYYDPCKGGMEAVAKTLIEGAIKKHNDISFTVYCNNHKQNQKAVKSNPFAQVNILRESTPVLLKSQPLNIFYKNLQKLIAENEVVHHHYPFPTMERALLKNLDALKHKKLIITWHANIQNSRWSWIEKIYNPMIIKLLDVADHIVVTSPQLFEQSSILKRYKNKIQIIPLSFDPKFAASEAKVLSDKKKKILFVGKLREYKGIKYLIEAMQKIDAQLDIVGNGEKEKELRDLVESLGLAHQINFWTHATDEDLELFYKNADLFVLPSINEAEAFGVVQLEAMGSATPVINTKLKSGVPHVSLDQITGLTVEPADVNELAEAANKILQNDSLYNKFSVNALERSKDFLVDKMVAKYIQLYA